MALLEEWTKIAYNEKQDKAVIQRFWNDYFLKENIKNLYNRGLIEKIDDNTYKKAFKIKIK